MAEKEEKSASIPWLPLITLIGVGSGVLFLSFQQLTSSRPGGGDPRLAANTFDDETIDARLWQDPLGVSIADREKNQRHGDAHSVGRFQDLLIKKCFPASALYPLRKEFRFVGEAKRLQEKRVEEEAKRIQIFVVMIPGGPYVEDVERRLRSRRAVIEGLGVAGYGPERDHEIGYFCVPWLPLQPNVATGATALEENRKEDETPELPGIRPTRSNSKEPDPHSLLIPYEWCEPTAFGADEESFAHVLILWLTDDALRDAPLARLADLISWFRLKLFTASGDGDLLRLPDFAVLGPDNSGTLHKMVLESKDDPWNDETLQCLATTHVYSSQAAAAESQLLSELPTMSGYRACKDLIEQKVKRSEWSDGFSFERTILLDDRIVKTLWRELECRGVKWGDHVAIISEEDTYYARALSSSFTHPDLDTIPTNVHSYTYLRGIDGKLPSDEKDERETKATAESGGNNSQSSSRPTERTEGVNQADDLRRLAERLQSLDTILRNKGGEGLKAVGLLGSDVYDKLELLKALRPMLPEAVFFTNNLDARLAHPDEWKETHNLVVVSAHGLSLRDSYQDYQRIAPFRDSGQTALFEATLEATGQIRIEDAIPKSPFIFEIGRNGAKELSIPERKSIPIEGVSRLVRSYLLPIGGFIVLGSLLLAWIHFVSRVTPEPAKAKTEAGERAREFILDKGTDGRQRVEAT